AIFGKLKNQPVRPHKCGKTQEQCQGDDELSHASSPIVVVDGPESTFASRMCADLFLLHSECTLLWVRCEFIVTRRVSEEIESSWAGVLAHASGYDGALSRVGCEFIV